MEKDVDKMINALSAKKVPIATLDKIWTKIQKNGKHAIIKLSEGYTAEDVGMRVGVL